MAPTTIGHQVVDETVIGEHRVLSAAIEQSGPISAAARPMKAVQIVAPLHPKVFRKRPAAEA